MSCGKVSIQISLGSFQLHHIFGKLDCGVRLPVNHTNYIATAMSINYPRRHNVCVTDEFGDFIDVLKFCISWDLLFSSHILRCST